MPTGFTYIAGDTWGRDRDQSLWVDVPAHMARYGMATENREARKLFARLAVRSLREEIPGCLIVARVDGMGRGRAPKERPTA